MLPNNGVLAEMIAVRVLLSACERYCFLGGANGRERFGAENRFIIGSHMELAQVSISTSSSL